MFQSPHGSPSQRMRALVSPWEHSQLMGALVEPYSNHGSPSQAMGGTVSPWEL